MRSLSEVLSWDLEQLDAYLAITSMKQDIQAASHAKARKDGERKNGRS